jgi:hypothetical protein
MGLGSGFLCVLSPLRGCGGLMPNLWARWSFLRPEANFYLCALPDSQIPWLPPTIVVVMARKTRRTKPHSTNILDYHINLSMIDKEDLVARAKLNEAREKEKEKLPKSNRR